MKRPLALAAALIVMLGGAVCAAPDPLEAQARRFVMLATALGRLYPREIDAYWGPPELDMRGRGPAPTLAGLGRDVERLHAEVLHDPPSPRRDRLAGRLGQLRALLAVIGKPHALSFDQQARQIYAVETPPPDPALQARALAVLARTLPGRGDVSTRLTAWRARFTIPADFRRAVFLRALAECRARTAKHWPLPPGEKVDVVWSAAVPAAWHRYQGAGRSRLEINPEAVADPGAALDVACHEAYPGHHAQFLALEAAAGPQGLAVEDKVVILRSADQALREGAAEAGVDLVFPAAERLAFTRKVLFPIAGLDPRQAGAFEKIRAAAALRSRAALPVLRDYYDGRMASGDAVAHLVIDAQIASPEALLDFTRDMGAYVSGYTAERLLVAACLSRQAGTDARWTALRAMAAERRLPCR